MPGTLWTRTICSLNASAAYCQVMLTPQATARGSDEESRTMRLTSCKLAFLSTAQYPRSV